MRSILTCLILIPVAVFGQWELKPSVGRGFVIPHRTVMRALVQNHATVAEIALTRRHREPGYWQQVYGGPSEGLSVQWIDLGNPNELGYGFNLNYLSAFPLNSARSLVFQIGLGAGYLTKTFDRKENLKNIAIGSALNASIILDLSYRFFRGKATHPSVGIRFNHFSNAAFRAPNLGVNIPNIYLAYHLVNRGNRVALPITEKWCDLPSTGWHAGLAIGAREVSRPGEQKYLTTELFAGRHWAISQKFTWQWQLDAFFNGAIPRIRELENSTAQTGDDRYQLGVSTGLNNHFGTRIFFLHAGYYLRAPYPGKKMYHRIGVLLPVNNRGYLRIALKSHLTTADYVSLGIRWNI